MDWNRSRLPAVIFPALFLPVSWLITIEQILWKHWLCSFTLGVAVGCTWFHPPLKDFVFLLLLLLFFKCHFYLLILAMGPLVTTAETFTNPCSPWTLPALALFALLPFLSFFFFQDWRCLRFHLPFYRRQRDVNILTLTPGCRTDWTWVRRFRFTLPLRSLLFCSYKYVSKKYTSIFGGGGLFVCFPSALTCTGLQNRLIPPGRRSGPPLWGFSFSEVWMVEMKRVRWCRAARPHTNRLSGRWSFGVAALLLFSYMCE